MAGIIVIMILIFGYLIWQVNRNLEPNVTEVIKPVYLETTQETDKILTEHNTIESHNEIEGSGYISMGLPEEADGSFKTYMDYEYLDNDIIRVLQEYTQIKLHRRK